MNFCCFLKTFCENIICLGAGSQTPDLALQQVLLLQSQYGQLEENEMSNCASASDSDLSQVDRAVNMARGLRSRNDIDVQLGILRDVQLALELSEASVRERTYEKIRNRVTQIERWLVF